jgi:hypothetical protein
MVQSKFLHAVTPQVGKDFLELVSRIIDRAKDDDFFENGHFEREQVVGGPAVRRGSFSLNLGCSSEESEREHGGQIDGLDTL